MKPACRAYLDQLQREGLVDDVMANDMVLALDQAQSALDDGVAPAGLAEELLALARALPTVSSDAITIGRLAGLSDTLLMLAEKL